MLSIERYANGASDGPHSLGRERAPRPVRYMSAESAAVPLICHDYPA